MAALGGCTKIGTLKVGKCGDMQGGEEFRVSCEDGVEGILGEWRIDAELKKRQVDHSAPWPSSWLRPSFPLCFSMINDNPSWLADRRDPAPLAITQVVRISKKWHGLP